MQVNTFMELRENISLQPYNTFGVQVNARYFASIHREEDIRQLLAYPQFHELPSLILGGGSNMLFVTDFPGTIVHNAIRGIELIDETEDEVFVRVGGGENWHAFVMHCVNNNWQGIENLSLIPGTVGAAPVQNIGAYGVELKEVFHHLEAIDLFSGQISEFTREACEFGYRTSIFKKELKGMYMITRVVLRLRKNPVFNVTYGAIESTLEENHVSQLSVKAISDAVIQIRESKLPDPQKVGNSGSFFKNPQIENHRYRALKETYPGMPGYPVDGGLTKVPAGWLIEHAGWKGHEEPNGVGCFEKQALVLVNRHGASGTAILAFSEKVQASVSKKFGIDLEPEVNVINY